MANFCIPKEFVEKVGKSISGLGDNAIEKLSTMSKKDRLEFFRKDLSDNAASRLNKEFEDAVLSSRVSALKNWVKNNLDKKYRDEYLKETLDKKIKNLDEFNQYIDQNAENFILKKENVALTGEEVKKFNELGIGLHEEAIKLGDEFGNLTDNYEGNLNFAKKMSALQEYTDQLSPSSKIKVFLNTVGKASMLASFKTILLNIESNTITGVAEAIARRLSNKSLGGKVSKKVAGTYMKNARKIFKETGIDVTRMIDMDNKITGIGVAVGEELSRPKSKAIRAYTDFIFNKGLSTPDVAFSSFAFTDSANLTASKLAKGNEAKATTIFKDATRIAPRTTEGEIVRNKAIQDAMYSTYTNDSYTSRINMNIRKLLNGSIDGLGDVVMPFVKTPSNVVEAGLDYSGLGGAKALVTAVKSVRGEGKITREAWASISRDLVRSGLGMTAAYAIVANIKAENFMGAYDPARVKIDQLDNTSYNAVKIGNKWISVDYFGVLGTPIVSMLYAKKYGKESVNNRVGSYLLGGATQFAKTPGIEPLANTAENLLSIKPEDSSKWFKVFGDRLKRDVGDIIVGRSVPALLSDLAKAADDVQRDTRQNKYVVKTPLIDINFDKFVAKLPFLRTTLPEKHDALGRVMMENGAFQSLMFGARVRTARMDSIVDEIYSLRDAGQTPNIKDLRFMYSSKVDELKEKVGEEKFIDISIEYGQELAKKYEKEMGKPAYQKKTPEEKKSALDKIGQDLYVKTLKRNGVKYR